MVDSMDPATGGPPSVIARLAAAQANAGHSVMIFCRGSLGIDVCNHSAFTNIPNINLVTWHLCPAGRITDKYLAFTASRALRALLKPQDILHLHGVWCAIVGAAARVARDYGTRYVVTPHGVLNPWSMAQKSWKKNFLLRINRRQLLESAAFVHALNEDEAGYLRALSIHTSITVIPNGIFAEEISDLPSPSLFRNRYPQLREQPYILFLSRLTTQKGLDILAQAFSRFAQRDAMTSLVVAGPDGGMRAEFEKQIADDGLSERVHVIGPIYGPEKFSALAGASCFCLPSRNEGFSMAITEALGCGVPVVISRECHFPEVQAVGAGEVVALDPVAIADALLRLTSDGARRQHSSHAARRLVLENYTWPRIAERMVEAYTQVGQPQTNIGGTAIESTP